MRYCPCCYNLFPVTLAKGIGNGFPLAAVVTTPEIADTMTKALHFNTYGGNPLASAVGSAVLDVSRGIHIALCSITTNIPLVTTL